MRSFLDYFATFFGKVESPEFRAEPTSENLASVTGHEHHGSSKEHYGNRHAYYGSFTGHYGVTANMTVVSQNKGSRWPQGRENL